MSLTPSKTPSIKKLLSRKSKIRLDIGCGENKQPGFVGMDLRPLPGVEIVHNVEQFPWPLPDNCVSVAVASHLVEHIDPHGGVFLNFMNEVWRVCEEDAQFAIATPYAGSPGYWQDPTHCNPCNEITWEYFDPESPIAKGMLWQIYTPKPWKIEYNVWRANGNMELLLRKRADDPKFYDFKKKETK